MDLDHAIRSLLDDVIQWPVEAFEEFEGELVSPDIKLDKPTFVDVGGADGLSDLTYVDGGSVVVIDYGPLLVEFNRAAAVKKSKGKSVRDAEVISYLSLTRLEKGNVRTQIYPVSSSRDDLWGQLVVPDAVRLNRRPVGRARRVGELLLAYTFLEDSDAVVVDGSLGHGSDQAEISWLSKVFERSEETHSALCGFAKSSSLTFNGFLLGSYVESAANESGLRHYVARVGRAERRMIQSGSYKTTEIYVCKLNSSSPKPYTVEVLPSESTYGLFSSLQEDCAIIGHPGYPSGLVRADRRARIVASTEREIVREKIRRAGMEAPIIKEIFAHDFLDSLAGHI
ncbi:MAG: hypothetical protein QW767_00195 [Thermoprotei archaeon]